MDAHLKALAEIGLHLTAAEEALDEGANTNARASLDAADDGLVALRSAWPTMSSAERTVVGRAAAPLRERLDAGRRRLPRLTALTEVAPLPGEADDDEDDDFDLPPAA